jgi:hypothetical protein
MEYSENAYQQLLKMRDLGKKNYDEERYTKSLVSLAAARQALQKAMDAYMKDPTDENDEIVETRDYDVFWEETQAMWFRDIMDGKRQDPKMTDTMYEIHGYKMKEEADKYFNAYILNTFGPKGYWTPPTQVNIMMSSCPVCKEGLAGSVYRPRCSVCPWDSQE